MSKPNPVDEIAAELAKLNNTKGFVSPVNFLTEDKYERTGVVGRGAVRKSALAKNRSEIEHVRERDSACSFCTHQPWSGPLHCR